MWEQFMNCFKKGGNEAKNCKAIKMDDLFRRVPPNQIKQFRAFAQLNEKYKSRMRKYPDKMPTIDWNYYKQNVRKEMVSWVEEYEKKYDKLDSMFANRHSMIDYSKYFGEVTEQSKVVEKEIKKYKEESEERIKILECKMEHLQCLLPYTEMTMEEFCEARPEIAPDFINNPTFWPHLPEEQKPGPIEEAVHEDEEGDSEKPDPKKPPPKTPPTSGGSAPAGAAPKTDAKAKKDDPKAAKPVDKKGKSKESEDNDEECISEEAESKDKMTAVSSKAKAKSGEDSNAITQGIEMAKDLANKAIVMLKGLWEKAEQKRKEIAEAAAAERQKSGAAKAKSSSLSEATKERINTGAKSKEPFSNICNKTIILGKDATKADVKKQHLDLDIEANQEEDPCEKEKSEKRKRCPDEKEEESKECESVCKQFKSCESDTEKQPPKKKASTCSIISDSKPSGVVQTSPKLSLDPTQAQSQQPAAIITCQSQQLDEPSGAAKSVKGQTEGHVVANAEEAAASGRLSAPVSGRSSETFKVVVDKARATAIAKNMFKTATNAATLLADAKKILEQSRLQRQDIASMRAIYEAAKAKASEAQAQADKAMDAAKKLVEEHDVDPQVMALIKKHGVLAKLLAHRAMNMKQELVKILKTLQGK